MTRALVVIRALYGAALLAAPVPVASVVAGGPLDRRARAVARVLGARELIQAELACRHPGRVPVLIGAWVDTAHAISMLALAVADRRRRRLAVAQAGTAAAFAAVSMLAQRG